MSEIDIIKQEMEYIAQQNDPYTAIGGGLRFLCNLKQVKYSDDETDAEIRKKLLNKIESEKTMKHKLSKNDTLIINGKEITQSNSEDFECEFEFGETTVDYTINLKVIKGSECYKRLKEAQENKDKYKVQVNIIKKEGE